ncbi:3-dehydroquinate synthase [Cerasibacillus terrae]|uniref:3-dehydroquinate synthase n=1 Tax=Cerasibacillus terrae TaxID=2498845 RepID=A0A5C8NH10_9BACI|nr:3-dehydroquinate synthase [Cerasibacillus terrae]TXL57858.1 3-dehydroquinate synthase [Cerasibacillus terrae]
MEQIPVITNAKQYKVFLGSHILEELLPFIKQEIDEYTKIFILTDETVGPLHLEKLMQALKGEDIVVYTVPSGEKAKTFDVYYNCLTFALENKLDRKSLLLAFGGGAVGDLGGFVAATFLRGIRFIQIPTTILAHDSAVGGKVAINHPLGKNMIGAFYQPEAVFYDLSFINTLPKREVRSGFAEVIKHALIHDEAFYRQLQTEVPSFEFLTGNTLLHALKKGIEVKSKIVKKDEKELGIRAYLNFGHTLGHAIEAEAGYGVMAHGEAVLIGMLFALKLSKDKLGLSFNEKELIEWVGQLGYETSINKQFSPEKLLQRMLQDKKTIGQEVRFVLLKEIGKPVVVTINHDDLLMHLKQFS